MCIPSPVPVIIVCVRVIGCFHYVGITAIDATKSEVHDGDHVDLPRIMFEFDKHQWSMLRRLIDRLNANTPP